MQKILQWKFTDQNLEQDLNDWEAEIERYEKESTHVVPDDVKVGILMSQSPTDLQKHLQLTTGLQSTFLEVRGIVLNYCKRRLLTKKKSPFGDDPMDVGAVWRWYQKGKGKGKKGKNKGKGKDFKGKGKGKYNDKGKSEGKGKSK